MPRDSKAAANGTVKWGVAVDLKRCTGCQSCTMACKLENGTPPGVFWTRVLEKEEGSYPFAYKVFMPIRCNHCGNPPCVEVCPTGARIFGEVGARSSPLNRFMRFNEIQVLKPNLNTEPKVYYANLDGEVR